MLALLSDKIANSNDEPNLKANQFKRGGIGHALLLVDFGLLCDFA